MQFLMLHIDKLVGKGIPLRVIIELIITNLAYMVVLAAPMAVLVATVMAYGRFSELNELTALKAAGINPLRIIAPSLFASGLLCVFLIWFSNDVLPDANQRARNLFIDIRMKKPGFDLEPNVFYKGIDGYTFLVKRMPSESDSLYDVTLFQEAETNRDPAVIKAQKGYLQSEHGQQMLTLYLYNGSILHDLSKNISRNKMMEETDFKKYRISFDLSDMAFSRSNRSKKGRSDRTMSAQAMLAVIDSLHSQIDKEKSRFNKQIRNILPQAAFTDTLETHEVKASTLFKSDSTQSDTTDTATVDLPESEYTILNNISNQDDRRSVINRALNTVRQIQSNYDNAAVNVHWRKSRIYQFMVEVYKKYSIPFACVAFLLLGAPIGMLTQKGNLGFAALVSAGLLTFYWISIIQGEKLADRMYISPFLGMWASDMLLTALGIYLLIRLSTSFKISNIWKSRD